MPGGRIDKLAVHGYVDALRHYPELAASAGNWPSACCIRAAAAFIGVDAPDFNLGLEQRLKRRRHQDRALRLPVDLGLARRPRQALGAAADHVLCLFPFEPELLQRHGVAATYVGHPLADAIPLQVPRAQARRRWAWPSTTPWSPCCPAAAGRDPPHRAGLLRAALLLQRSAPGCASCCRWRLGCARLLEPLVAQHAPGLAAAARRWLARGAGRLRRDLDRQRHRHAGGRAVQAADGHRLPHARLSWQLMKRMAYQPWVGLPNILCREFVVPELLQHACHARGAGAGRWRGWTMRRRVRAGRSALPTAPLLRATPRRRATDAIAQVLKPERLGLDAGPARACWPASTRPGAARWPGRWWRRR
jgi:lipid-A-disaccharide synthase